MSVILCVEQLVAMSKSECPQSVARDAEGIGLQLVRERVKQYEVRNVRRCTIRLRVLIGPYAAWWWTNSPCSAQPPSLCVTAAADAA